MASISAQSVAARRVSRMEPCRLGPSTSTRRRPSDTQQEHPTRSPSDSRRVTQRLGYTASRATRGLRRGRALSRLSGEGAERELNGWRRYTATHRGGRHRAEPAASTPTTETRGSALLTLSRIRQIHRGCTPASSPRCLGTIHLGMGTIHDANIHWTSRVPAEGACHRGCLPSTGVMNPCRPRCGKLGLGWPQSAHRWTGTTCRAASLDCSGREMPARARLKRVEDGGRAEPGHDSRFYRWKLVTHVSTDDGNGTLPQRFVTLHYVRIESDRLCTRFPVHSTVNTSGTTAHSCGKPSLPQACRKSEQPLKRVAGALASCATSPRSCGREMGGGCFRCESAGECGTGVAANRRVRPRLRNQLGRMELAQAGSARPTSLGGGCGTGPWGWESGLA
jgi:hypothetical protein